MVTWGQKLDATLLKLRAEAETRMTVALWVWRPNLITLESGEVVREQQSIYGTPEQPGKGRVREMQMLGGALIADAAGNLQVMATATVHLPFSSPEIKPGDIVTVLDAPRAPELNGKELVVASASVDSQATAKRLQVRVTQYGGAARD